MTDLFAEFYTDEQIDQVFAVMALAQQHTFQVLTKRTRRASTYLKNHAAGGRHVWTAAQQIEMPSGTDKPEPGWPLPNVWLGCSVEDQKNADERIPDLLNTPAAVHWLSIEPLLGPLRLKRMVADETERDYLRGLDQATMQHRAIPPVSLGGRVDWVVLGFESGPGARPGHPDWARRVRDDCISANVPFFFKQWGSYRPLAPIQDSGLSRAEKRAVAGANEARTIAVTHEGQVYWLSDDDPVPGGMAAYAMERVAREISGRLLDGREWNEMPKLLPA
jgi:protein gp37